MDVLFQSWRVMACVKIGFVTINLPPFTGMMDKKGLTLILAGITTNYLQRTFNELGCGEVKE